MTAEQAASPLALVAQSAGIQRLIEQLQRTRLRLEQQPDKLHKLHFSRRELRQTGEDFNRAIRRGQNKLHHLCALLAQSLFDGPFEVRSLVVGEVAATRERFTLSEAVAPEELFRLSDLELAKQMLHRLSFQTADGTSRARLVANLVEYLPHQSNRWGIFKLLSRIKGDQEIWSKVVDELFELDHLVRRDKQLRELSRYVKDLFGLKLVVSDAGAATALADQLQALRWSEAELALAQVPAASACHQLEVLEVKDYRHDSAKASGWQALKMVVRWWDATFEIQIQSLHSYHAELQRFNQDSHESFRQRRHELRRRISQEIPLFGYYSLLLRRLFQIPGPGALPEFPGIAIELSD